MYCTWNQNGYHRQIQHMYYSSPLLVQKFSPILQYLVANTKLISSTNQLFLQKSRGVSCFKRRSNFFRLVGISNLWVLSVSVFAFSPSRGRGSHGLACSLHHCPTPFISAVTLGSEIKWSQTNAHSYQLAHAVLSLDAGFWFWLDCFGIRAMFFSIKLVLWLSAHQR